MCLHLRLEFISLSYMHALSSLSCFGNETDIALCLMIYLREDCDFRVPCIKRCMGTGERGDASGSVVFPMGPSSIQNNFLTN